VAHPNLVRVEIRCGCGERMPWCVRIDRNVPEQLRCGGGGGSGGGGPRDVRCSKCGRRCFDSPEALERAANQATRGGWGRHQREGAVVLEC
jgi:hypothetical protein